MAPVVSHDCLAAEPEVAADASAGKQHQPADCLSSVGQAFLKQDRALFETCVHPAARQLLAGKEMFAFWTKQFAELTEAGFKGEWHLQQTADKDVSKRLPKGSVTAQPRLADKQLADVRVLLVQVEGQWVIVRLE